MFSQLFLGCLICLDLFLKAKSTIHTFFEVATKPAFFLRISVVFARFILSNIRIQKVVNHDQNKGKK